MDFAELQRGLFADCQVWHFQAAKRSDMSSTIMQEGRFADAQESRFQTRNVQKCANLFRKWVDLLMLRKRVFKLRNFQIWALQS